jgi:hypothetical protein
MADVTEITLGTRKVGIRRLTIGQLLDLNVIQMTGTSTNMSPPKATLLSAKIAALRKAGAVTDADLAELNAMVNQPEATANEPGDVFMRRMGTRMLESIAAACKRDFADLTAKSISEIEMTNEELRVAYATVLTHAGLITPGETEAPASP